jgi:hypothetical protein
MGVRLDLFLLWEKNINYDIYNKVFRKVPRPEEDEVSGKFSILHSKELIYLCNPSTIFKLVNFWRLQ